MILCVLTGLLHKAKTCGVSQVGLAQGRCTNPQVPSSSQGQELRLAAILLDTQLHGSLAELPLSKLVDCHEGCRVSS
jgi:hypothetical protein